MSREIFVLPVAKAEAIATRKWYERHAPRAAAGFVRRLREAFVALAERPASVGYLEKPVRRLRLKQYRYSVIFQEVDDGIEVLGIVSDKRQSRNSEQGPLSS